MYTKPRKPRISVSKVNLINYEIEIPVLNAEY